MNLHYFGRQFSAPESPKWFLISGLYHIFTSIMVGLLLYGLGTFKSESTWWVFMNLALTIPFVFLIVKGACSIIFGILFGSLKHFQDGAKAWSIKYKCPSPSRIPIIAPSGGVSVGRSKRIDGWTRQFMWCSGACLSIFTLTLIDYSSFLLDVKLQIIGAGLLITMGLLTPVILTIRPLDRAS